MRRFPTRIPTLLIAFLLASAPVLGQVPCDLDYNDFNGPQSLFLNLHNCGTACADAELPYLELVRDGLSGVRIFPVTRDRAQPGDPSFYEVNDFDPYLEGVLEIFGPENVLVLVDDGVDRGRHAKPTPAEMLRKLRSLIETHPSVQLVEFMNEPSNFSDIRPAEYVGRYLRSARRMIDDFNRNRPADEQILLFSAAWFGNRDGVRETQRMVRAGALGLIDVLTAHLYADREDEAEAIAAEYLRLARGKPVAVTETNFNRGNRSNYEAQGWWICRSMVRIEETLRRGLNAAERAVQFNVLYTLRADEERLFNVISFPDSRQPLFWQPTGPGHTILIERSKIPTDPRSSPPPANEQEDADENHGDPLPLSSLGEPLSGGSLGGR